MSLVHALTVVGMDAAQIPRLIGMVRASSERYLSDPCMPIQDAISVRQRDLPMPPYEFQTANQSSGGLSSRAGDGVGPQRSVEAATLRNFFVR